MLQPWFEQQRKSIETKLRSLLNSDLPQVIPFLNAIGLSKKSNDLPLSALNHDEISSIWYWLGIWDPILQIVDTIVIKSWLKPLLFNKILYKITFLRRFYNNKYEMMRSFDKSYHIISWFTRHLFIARFIFKMDISSEIQNINFLSTFYYRFMGYFSSTWYQLLFHIDIYAPTLPLFLDNLQNNKNTVDTIQKCAHLCNNVYGPQNFTMKLIRQLRWAILPNSMNDALKQYSYSKYDRFVHQQLQKNGFILKILHISDSHNILLEKEEKTIENESVGRNILSYMIVIEKSTNYLYVVFRGTELLTDFYHDMFFSDVQSTYSHISVHAGYYCALFGPGYSNILSIEQEINKILMEIPTISKIYFTGHSMGGALACLCGMELLARGQLLRTPWYDESKSIYHQKSQSSPSSQSEENNKNEFDDYNNSKNIQRLFKEYMKLSTNDSTFYDKTELNKIDIEFITFGHPCFISSLTENKKLQKLQKSHDIYTTSYFHNHSIHVTHQYDPIPILSFGTFGVLQRHFLTWFTKGHLNRFFQPTVITLGSVITAKSLGLEAKLSIFMGLDSTKNNVFFGRLLMCLAIHQVIKNKILVKLSKSIYNQLNYSSFNELDKINKSLVKTLGFKYLNLLINWSLYPTIFYLMDKGFLDYGIWRSLSLRVIATRFTVSTIITIWNNVTTIVRDLYDEATYFPIPNKSGKYIVLIPEDDVLYGTHYRKIKNTTGYAYFETMQKAVQPYTWVSIHTMQYYCKCIDRIATLDDYNPNRMNDHGLSTTSSHERSRRTSIQYQQQIQVSMFPNHINSVS